MHPKSRGLPSSDIIKMSSTNLAQQAMVSSTMGHRDTPQRRHSANSPSRGPSNNSSGKGNGGSLSANAMPFIPSTATQKKPSKANPKLPDGERRKASIDETGVVGKNGDIWERREKTQAVAVAQASGSRRANAREERSSCAAAQHKPVADHSQTGGYAHSRVHHHQYQARRHSRAAPKPPADMALNRFRFILSSSSILCNLPLNTLLALPSSELWPHTVAVTALDYDPICSICLDIVTAARALVCGHIFCAVCIHRCLRAAARDPMLEKCPVCSEGELSSAALRRCEMLSEKSQPNTFSLVFSLSGGELPVYQDDADSFSARVHIASGEGMMRLIEKERNELKMCKADLQRFRDTLGLQLLNALEAELDKNHVEWTRQVGKRTDRAKTSTTKTNDWFYQRSDGALDYLHPIHLRCLNRHAHNDSYQLPATVSPVAVLEVEDWSGRNGKLATMLRIGRAQLPEFPPSCRLFECELSGMSGEAVNLVAKETKERAKRREDKERRKIKAQQVVLKQELSAEEQRRKARENEEALIRAFFGFEERRAEQELKEARERPKPAVNSFSAIVSSMGHFPALQPTTTSAAKPASNTSPVLEPLRPSGAAWGGASPLSASSLGSSPPGDVSFARAATQGPGKKVLWQNNPGRRSNW